MIPLKVTTEYSLLKSLIKIPDLINFLVQNNINACGICDDEMFGAMEFYLKCKEKNIKPLIGLDIVIDGAHIYLYAKNYLGYQTLLKINTKKYDGLNYSDLENENVLIVLPYASVDIYGEFKNKKNLYLGYQNNREKNSSLLVSENIVYVRDFRALKQSGVEYLKYLQDLGGKFTFDEGSYLNLNISSEDKKYLENFSNQINIELPFDKRYIPEYKSGTNSYVYLSTLANKGLEKRCNGSVPDSYKKRLEEELDVIKQMGFTDYFLIVYDYVLFAKKNGILVGPGRGSAAGSLVSYAIGITNIDPMKYDLLFARFLNPYRKKMPDIDIDFEDSRRGEVINYVKEKYGEDKVAVGITFSTLKCKLVIRDIARVLKIDNGLLEKFIKVIDGNKTLKENLKNEVVKKYLELYKELNHLYDICLHLENLKKNISTHAAGVVICSKSLDEIIPIYKENDLIRTGYAMEYLEMQGLLKMDFLGLRNLGIIGDIVKEIPDFKIEEINLEDAEVYKIFQNAETDDIFQFESNYAKNNLLKLKVSSFNELAIATALVRPGPSNQIDEYVKNKKTGSFKLHPDLEPILKSTYGVIIFQEQVMKILEVIGGYTQYEADNVRIAMSKKKEGIILKEEQTFINNALKKGYQKDFVVDLFNKIKKFAEYGFNKAHSVSYALIAYELAYLKVHYPIEFTSSLLKGAKDNQTKKRLLNNLKERKVKILKPNINFSNNEFQYKNGSLLLPFNIIKNFTENLANDILERRTSSFKDIYEFILRCQDKLNPKTYELLVLSGCLDTFKYTRKTLIENSDILFNYASLNDESAEKPLLKIYDEYEAAELRSHENEYYGFYVGNHPCSVYKDVVKANNTKDFLFKNINMVLLVEKIVKIKTKKNEEMAFVTASDETGSLELTMFPEVLKQHNDLKNNDIIFVNGKSSKRFDKYQIIVNNIKRK
ncbi:MAG: DNA polymerase III subunit alpha [Bacilli bacterium]|nr:DNA polymerase III subunit alpha [Bacilli bacterium]